MKFYEGKLLKPNDNGQLVSFDAKHLRSSLLHLMKLEASEICSPTKTGYGFIPPSIQVYNQNSNAQNYTVIIIAYL